MVTREETLQAEQAAALAPPQLTITSPQPSGTIASTVQTVQPEVKTEAELKQDFAREQTAIIQKRIDSYTQRILDVTARQHDALGSSWRRLEAEKQSLMKARELTREVLSLAKTGNYRAESLLEHAGDKIIIEQARTEESKAARDALKTMTVTTKEIPQQTISGEQLQVRREEIDAERKRALARQFDIGVLTTREQGIDLPSAQQTAWTQLTKTPMEVGASLFALDTASTKIEEAIRPEVKAQRLREEAITRDVLAFNSRVEGRQLTKEEFDKATKDTEALQKRIDAAELGAIKIQQQFKIGEKDITDPRGVQKARVVVGGFAVGAATAIPRLVAFGGRLFTSPIQTGREAIAGFVALPKAIKDQPLKIVPEIVGQLLFFAGVSKAISSLKTRTRVSSFKPKLEIQVTTSQALKIGKNTWRVSGKAVGKYINPKTGKVIETVVTKTSSEVVTSASKSGALKSFVKTQALEFQKSNIAVVLGKTPKISIKGSTISAKGTVTFTPDEVSNLFRGRGEFAIQETGRFRASTIGTKTTTKITPKLGRQFDALTDILAKQTKAGTGQATYLRVDPKQKTIAGVTGTQQQFSIKALTNIYGKQGATELVKSVGFGKATSFTPKSLFLQIGKKAPKITRVPAAPSLSKPTTSGFVPRPSTVTKVIPKVIPKQAAAQASAFATTEAIAKRILGQTKRVAVTSKVVAVSTSQILIPSLLLGQAAQARQRQVTKTKQVPALRQFGMTAQVPVTRQIPITRQAGAVAQASVSRLLLGTTTVQKAA